MVDKNKHFARKILTACQAASARHPFRALAKIAKSPEFIGQPQENAPLLIHTVGFHSPIKTHS